MFSLIITLIAIALVALLALATLYYGGDSFNKGQTESDATAVVTQVQQILGAMSVSKAEHQSESATLATLLNNNYLKSIPTFKNKAWETVAGLGNASWLPLVVNKETCQSINKKLIGTDGIPELPVNAWSAHCFGAQGNYSVVINSTEDVSGPLGIPAVMSQAYQDAGISFKQDTMVSGIPATTGNGWDVAPTLTPWSGSSSSGGTASSGLIYDEATMSFNKASVAFAGVNYDDVYRIWFYCKHGAIDRYLFTQMWFSRAADGSTIVDTSMPLVVGSCSPGTVADAVTIRYYNDTEVTYPLTITVK